MGNTQNEPLPARYDVLDGMRGVAALCVMFYHYTLQTTFPVFANASLAVDLFFMLSGFVIAHSYGSRLRVGMSPADYVGKRLIRLFPMFIIGLLIGEPVLYLFAQTGWANFSWEELVGGAAYNLLFLPFFNGLSIHGIGEGGSTVGELFPANPPAWSLFFELFASFLYLFLFKLGVKRLKKGVILSFFGLLLAGFLALLARHKVGIDLDVGWGEANFLGGFPRVIFGFTIGVLGHALSQDERVLRLAAAARKYLRNVYGLYLFLILVFLFPKMFRGLYPLLILVTVAPLVVFVGPHLPCEGKMARNLARFLGWLSYPVYCLHVPVGRAVSFVWGGVQGADVTIVFVSSALTLLLAIGLTLFVEQPVRVWLTRKHKAFLSREQPSEAV